MIDKVTVGGGNSNLRRADREQNDEFYTQLSDIESELSHYKEFFAGKTVFCNCDDPYESNFVKYFALQFNMLKLKKLIATSYETSPIAWVQLSLLDNHSVVVKQSNGKLPYKIEITEVKDYNGDGAIDQLDIEYILKNGENSLSVLSGDNGYKGGDFRSKQCIELLKEADVVVTNPPFSLFREYVAQLVQYNKKFIIIGNINAITYKEIFPLIKDNKLWTGYHCGQQEFFVPETFKKDNVYIDEKGNRKAKFGNICWYTNVETTKRREKLDLYKYYSSEEYPKYDNYDAIEVSKVKEIPRDYFGYMGVPITFLDSYNPEQFEVIDGIGRYSILNNEETKKAGKYLSMINGVAKYFRIIIRRKK